MALLGCGYSFSVVLQVLIVLVSNFTKNLDAAALVSDVDSYFGNDRLEQRSRENVAVARLYENVLDALQCRPPPAPVPADEVLRANQALSSTEPIAARQPEQDLNWSGPRRVLGQVAGVAVDPEGRPVVFHRGDHTWQYE
ncbi:hypothetical protein QAD02_005009 [Eretmocerus hayati]|uniref:Uncharacterized protein n=1 Tax=Eretmocerus hayati TaxID=131215 RepID=A0ACC2NRL4_9HYME|nr:hypothetical protein QAD02_005009 [Eretmocerus hayati]